MKRTSAFLILGLLAAMMGSARAAVFYPSHFTLSNGLEVVVVPNRMAPVVSQMVWYKVGAIDEVPGKSGLAHYLEHLMFRGTDTIPPGEFSKIIAAQGGEDNAFTTHDYTAYYEEVASDRLSMIMQMEADRMKNLKITKEIAEPELRVVLGERQQRTDNSPDGRFTEKFAAKFLAHHPYGRPVIGWKKEIEKLSVADARKFYETYYAPNNAIVVISGDVKVDDVMSLAAATYGRVPRKETPPPRKIAALPQATGGDFTYTDARVEQPQVLWRFAAPSYATQTGNAAYAHEVLSEALDSGEVGVLYKKLVHEQGIASGIQTSFDPDARGEADFSISASLRPGKSNADLQNAMRATLNETASQGIDAATIETAKQRLLRAAIFAREGLLVPGYAFGSALTTGHGVADVEEWPDRINDVTTDQVNAALKDLVASKRQMMGALLPDPRASNKKKPPAPPSALKERGEIR